MGALEQKIRILFLNHLRLENINNDFQNVVLRNDDKIKYTILLVLFHFYFVTRVFK